MLDQYRRIKREQEGNILFFRLGDFYEMFAEDAIEVSSLLNLTLTSRNGLPMCGVPYHASRSYIARLLKLGKKIAVCEQLTQPAKGIKVLERDVVEIITPGTTIDEDFLDKGSSNYLGCLASCPLNGQKLFSFSYVDLSTGEFFASSFPGQNTEILRQELERLSIRELLIQESLLEENQDAASAVYDRSGIVLNRYADWLFDPVQAKSRLEKQFGLANLKSFGLQEECAEIIAAGTLLDYLDTTSKSLLPHIKTLKVYQDSEYMGIDESSQRNLELLYNQRDGEVRFSLLEVMDQTRCSMGRRLLKRRILHPLRDINKINSRLDMAEDLYRDQGKLSSLRDLLGKTPDLERLCSRLAMDKAHGRDMLAIKNAVNSFYGVLKLGFPGNLKFECEDDFSFCESTHKESILGGIVELLEKGICEEPSILLNEGNLIKDGFSEELDKYRSLKNEGRRFLEEYLEEERAASGIPSLKIKYNRLIGYFFEVTKTNLTKVPKHFIRRQGIAGGERYSTDRLAQLESEINGATDRAIELEKKIFLEIRDQVKKALDSLAAAARRLAELDAAQSLAKAASINGWTRPQLNESANLEIYEGRHPVVEAHLNRGEYIPNDILLNTENGIAFAMITGPNMAGKSTYLRSAALITIMAQAGSFVPASEARIGICDRIYCRVGASDNLARGESTFLVEMNETAFILNTATKKSLVIMDEVGRGTGTNDGLSIAWAVSEELLNRIGCRTLFATHFHELSLLSHTNLANRSMEVLDKDGKIVFLRKLKEGPAAESYGIHVARLAGLSEKVLERAEEIMALLKTRDSDLSETFDSNSREQGAKSKEKRKEGKKRIFVNLNNNVVNGNNGDQSVDFAGTTAKKSGLIIKLISELDPDKLTPMEALALLNQWKKQLQEGVPSQKQPKPKQHGHDNQTPSLFD
uniref:DNA mismatch repair protein MutS n=1 Tax=uncultured bacterium contig00024 TaxID=1181513 RepID=A0A806KNE1_9BACT|nr:DNA mismatch repair protein MutS [uncultured bacterium contig00024]